MYCDRRAHRNSSIKRYKLYKVVGLEKEFPMTSSVRLALKMTKRWLRCRCLKSNVDQLQQQYTFKPVAMNAPVDAFCKPSIDACLRLDYKYSIK